MSLNRVLERIPCRKCIKAFSRGIAIFVQIFDNKQGNIANVIER